MTAAVASQHAGRVRRGWGLPVTQRQVLITRVAIGGNVWSPAERERRREEPGDGTMERQKNDMPHQRDTGKDESQDPGRKQEDKRWKRVREM